MPSTWQKIHDHLLRTSSTLGFQRQFLPLHQFSDPAALLDALHYGSFTAEEKNRLLIALVEAAQLDQPEADCALTLLLLAVWPGLDAVRHRAQSGQLGACDDIVSDILARATEAIRNLDLRRVKRVAATVVRNIERDLGRARQREVTHVARQREIDPDELAGDEYEASPAHLQEEIRRLIGRDAGLVIGVAVDGFSPGDLGPGLGLTAAAARKRYQRAIGRLRTSHEFF